MVQICWLKISMVLCSYRFWIRNLEMFNKSLPHIIFNKWTFIDLMSNLMEVCATWKVRSWNSIHTLNSFTLIFWDSSNNASTLLIKYGLYLILIATCTPSITVGFALGNTTISYLVISIGSTPLDILMP